MHPIVHPMMQQMQVASYDAAQSITVRLAPIYVPVGPNTNLMSHGKSLGRGL